MYPRNVYSYGITPNITVKSLIRAGKKLAKRLSLSNHCKCEEKIKVPGLARTKEMLSDMNKSPSVPEFTRKSKKRKLPVFAKLKKLRYRGRGRV